MSQWPLARRLATILMIGATLAIATSAAAEAAEATWPEWRGPKGSGIAAKADLPVHWSREKNIRWRTPLPEPGNSTPIVWGERIFLTQPLAKENRRTLMCLARADGKLLWQAGVEYAEKETTYETNFYCSASPVTDGKHVVAWFGSAGLVCYDLNGREIWKRDLGKQQHMWGYSSSPILFENLCILTFGPGNREFLIALDKRTGKTVWQIDAPPPPAEGDLVETGSGTSPENRNQDNKQPRADILRGAWSTPVVVYPNANEPELIVTDPGKVSGIDPRTGKELWNCEGLGALVYASPMTTDEVVVALGGYHSASLAVRTGGRGNVTDTRRLWHMPKTKLWLGTGVISGPKFYVATMESIVECAELNTGNVLWQQRLPGTSGSNASWSSLIMAGSRIYASNQAGDTFVFEVEPQFKLLATNSLEENTNSSLAVAGTDFLLRTYDALWCVSEDGKTKND